MLGCPFRGLVQSGTPSQRDPLRHAQRPARRRGPRTPRAPDPPLYRSPRRQPRAVVTSDPQLVAGWRRLSQPRARHRRPQNQRRGLMRHRTTSLTNTDGWEHTIKVERITDPMPSLTYPLLIDATGRCPPEDVGGPWGYAEFLAAIGDPKHESHAEMVQWVGAPFDPNTIDFDEHAKAVEALAKAWSRKPATKRKSATGSAA